MIDGEMMEKLKPLSEDEYMIESTDFLQLITANRKHNLEEYIKRQQHKQEEQQTLV